MNGMVSKMTENCRITVEAAGACIVQLPRRSFFWVRDHGRTILRIERKMHSFQDIFHIFVSHRVHKRKRINNVCILYPKFHSSPSPPPTLSPGFYIVRFRSNFFMQINFGMAQKPQFLLIEKERFPEKYF